MHLYRLNLFPENVFEHEKQAATKTDSAYIAQRGMI